MKKLILLFSLLLPNIAQSKCYIIGDSIAQGISQHIKECASATKVGLNTNLAHTSFTKHGVLSANRIIISLGINDKAQGTKTLINLSDIRENLKAEKIIWILPNTNYREQHTIVKKIAEHYGDSYLDITTVISSDGIHPTISGYKKIAQSLQKYHNK